MAKQRLGTGEQGGSWVVALPRHVKRAFRAMMSPFEVRCSRCGASMEVLHDTPTMMTPSVICWRRDAECHRCGHHESKQIVQHLPDGL